MVILIAAESCTGKTLMAQKLLEIYKIPYLSIDHLKMGIYRAGGECGFTPVSDNYIIEEKLWPVIKGIIKTNIENNQSIIIEGCYISPARLSEFEDEYSKYIIPVFMVFSERYVNENYKSKIIGYRSAIELRDECEERTAEQIADENRLLKRNCIEHNVRFFEIDEDYEKDTSKIYEWIQAESINKNILPNKEVKL